MCSLSLCIPTMNRFDSFLRVYLQSYLQYLKEGIINEIVICDETGDDYQKINDYYELEKKLPSDTHMEFSNQKLKSIGKGVDEDLLGFLGFIELIGVDKFDRYNTIDLYNRMLAEIRSLPDIKNSDDVIRDYNIFRGIMQRRDSPSKDLGIVLTIRFEDEYDYYHRLVNKDF